MVINPRAHAVIPEQPPRESIHNVKGERGDSKCRSDARFHASTGFGTALRAKLLAYLMSSSDTLFPTCVVR